MELMGSISVMAFACLVKGFLRSREMSRDKLSQLGPLGRLLEMI